MGWEILFDPRALRELDDLDKPARNRKVRHYEHFSS